MPYKNSNLRREKQRGYCKDHYQNNKLEYLEKNHRHKEKLRKIVEEEKAFRGKKCVVCNQVFHSCQLDFHHVRDVKSFNIGM